MLSKNNFKERLRKMEDREDRFSIRKFSIGTVSVLIGSVIFGMQSAEVAHADTITENNSSTLVTNKETSETKKVDEKTQGISSSPVQTSQQNKEVGKDQQVGQKDQKVSLPAEKVSSYKEAKTPIKTEVPASHSNDSKNQIEGESNNKPTFQPKIFAAAKDSTIPSNSNAVIISDSQNYPKTNGIVPANQYIFDQFTLTKGTPDSNNIYTPLNMLITLATDRTNPGGNLNYYITNRDYSQIYAQNTIGVEQSINYAGSNPYPDSTLTIYNFGPHGISIKEDNSNYGLAYTFGYGKYDSMINSQDPNPFSSYNVSNAWGDTAPSKATQTISYVDANTKKLIEPPITSSGLTGQRYQMSPSAEKVIPGYYLVNKERAEGVISQYKNGGTYTNEWVDLNGHRVKEVWHQISPKGKMQADIYIDEQPYIDPSNPQGIVYPPEKSKDGPTQLEIAGGSYIFPNPYVEQTTDIKLKYKPLGKIIPVDPS
ncbi:YSIRK-type signal peptide-containing protein, partial [Lactobacillus johnsonii]|uniref:YSIRK-type signal peptide-containing protein n=1 Tax=Lactobacillus johnsonii TaxID=33959 RepID=UPI0022E41693